LRSEEVVKNQEEDVMDEEIKVTHDLHWEKGKKVSTEASSTLTHVPALPKSHESSLLELLDEQTEVIQVEKLSKYSPHSILVHDSFPDEKLFENSQSDVLRSMNIRTYLSVVEFILYGPREEKIGASSLNSKATTNSVRAVQDLKHICPNWWY